MACCPAREQSVTLMSHLKQCICGRFLQILILLPFLHSPRRPVLFPRNPPKRCSRLVGQNGKAVRQPRLNSRYRLRFILISHRQCNFANKPVFAPVKANFPLLLDDHLFDDTATESLSRRFLRDWTTRLHPA